VVAARVTAMHDRPGIHNELVVAYTVLPGSTPACDVMPACRANHVSWFAHAPWPAARRQHAIAIPAHTDP